MDRQLLALRLKGALPPVTRGSVVKHSSCCYSVPSYSEKGRKHTVVGKDDSWYCSCLSYSFRRGSCRHILAARAAFPARVPKPSPEPVVIRSVPAGTCAKCGSANSKKDGVRRNQMYTNQKYRCLDCGHYFSGNAGLGRTKLPPKSVCRVMQMASSGTSYGDILDSLAGDGIYVCTKTVCNIVRRFSKILIEYSDQLHPCAYEVWRTDEMYLKALGVKLYLHSLMDDQTRLLLSIQLTPRKGEDDVSRMYEIGAIWADQIPHLLISDGAKSFHAAWCACYKPDNDLQKHSEHVSSIHLDGNMNNNMMESLNRELGRRMWAARFVSAKAAEAMAERVRLFYNFSHRHSGLGGKTPAEAGGIVVEGHDRWLILLQNAHACKAAG